MTVICLEGPSAAGKTTLSRELGDRIGAISVPEVNQLFQRPAQEAPDWYLDRQLERWRRASGASATGQVAVLDGDVLQPLWYGWAYGFSDSSALAVEAGELDFADAYFIVECAPSELRRRKELDATRSRRNFEQHLQLIAPQRRYFDALEQSCPGLVHRLPFATVAENAGLVESRLADGIQTGRPPATVILDSLVPLLRESAR